MSSYDEIICKKIYIIKFEHINIILIPGSGEFDVLKKLWRIVLCSLAEIVAYDELYGGELLLKIIMIAPTLIQSQRDRWLLEQVVVRVIKKVYS